MSEVLRVGLKPPCPAENKHVAAGAIEIGAFCQLAQRYCTRKPHLHLKAKRCNPREEMMSLWYLAR